MGIRRVEHKEEAITMTTAAEIEAQDQGLDNGEDDSDSEMFVDAATPKSEAGRADDRVWEHAAPKVRVKEEPTDGDSMDIDSLPSEGQFKTPDSPELKKKDLVASDEKKKKKRKTAAKDLEDEITERDLDRMLHMFTLGEKEGHAKELEGHMFLFQFPPVLPPLNQVPDEGAPTLVKPEPADDDDLFVTNAPPKATANIDLTNEPDTEVKKEEGEADESEVKVKVEDTIKEGGFIGNLVVRKSGKVELDWGGSTLILDLGTQSSFLQQAVILEEADAKPGQATEMSGAAFGMGKIQGSFGLAPKLSDEEEWVVDPDDLIVPA